MKSLIIIILSIFTFQVKGQEDTIMKIDIKGVDTTLALYNYYIIDSTIYPKRNLIVIKQMWVDKGNREINGKLQLGQLLVVEVNPIGPEKTIFGNDTTILRGHARARNSCFIDGQLIQKGNQNKSEFIKENAAIRIDYFELKKIKTLGNKTYKQ